MKKRNIVFAGLIVAIIGAYVALANDADRGAGTAAPQDVKRLVADYSAGALKAQSASITSEQLVITEKNGGQTVYDLPKDEFFVSVAPFVTNTHPCAVHNLVSCRGEMAGETFDVAIIEDASGDVVLDGPVRAGANGFIDLWLPRDKTYAITVAHEGKSSTSTLSTFQGDDTCVTTLQLVEGGSI